MCNGRPPIHKYQVFWLTPPEEGVREAFGPIYDFFARCLLIIVNQALRLGRVE
jgi:hypothetical protein